MSLIRNHQRLSAYFQLAIVSLTYIREIMLLLGIVTLASPIYYASIGLMLLWNLVLLRTPGRKDWANVFFYGFLLVVGTLLVLECRKHEGALVAAVGRIISVLYFLNLVRNTANGGRQLLRFNTFWCVAYTVLLFVMALSGYSRNDHGQLVFSYGNPNLTGLSAYICVVNLVVGLYVCRANGERLLTCISIVLGLFVCLLSKSRASLLSIGVFLFLAVLICKTRGKKLSKMIVVAGPLLLLLFPPFWILFYNLVGDPEWTVLGKIVFSYRELIWDYMYEVLLSSPFTIHMGQAVEHGSGPHNVPLAVWWDYAATRNNVEIVIVCRHPVVAQITKVDSEELFALLLCQLDNIRKNNITELLARCVVVEATHLWVTNHCHDVVVHRSISLFEGKVCDCSL